MNRDQALSRIKKCMALSRSSNPHEAAAAMRQAQKLMQEYGIGEDDVQLAEVHEVNRRIAMQSAPRWEVALANLVGEAFACRAIFSARYAQIGARIGRRTSVVFIGVGNSPEVAGYAWDVLDRQCAQQRLAHVRQQPRSCKPITLTARGDAFAEGWVLGVREKLQAFSGDERHQVLIEQYFVVNYPNLTSAAAKSRAVGRNVREGSHEAGFVAGRQARLDRGVGAAAQDLLA